MDFDIDTEWESFLETNEIGEMLDTKVVDSTEVPVTDPLYISTKSLICFGVFLSWNILAHPKG